MAHSVIAHRFGERFGAQGTEREQGVVPNAPWDDKERLSSGAFSLRRETRPPRVLLVAHSVIGHRFGERFGAQGIAGMEGFGGGRQNQKVGRAAAERKFKRLHTGGIERVVP